MLVSVFLGITGMTEDEVVPKPQLSDVAIHITVWAGMLLAAITR